MTTIAAAADLPLASDQPLVLKPLVKWHLIFAFGFMLTSMTWGFLVSLQFLDLYPLSGISFFSYGRLRLLHTNEIAYGFLVNAFLAGLYYCVPRLTGRPVLNARLGWLILGVWQLLMVLTSVGQLLGYGQAVEWGETPTGFRPGTFELELRPDRLPDRGSARCSSRCSSCRRS